MLIDARALPNGETLEADVCIIGAGPAGITIAREFVGKDISVCLLESGGTDRRAADQRLGVGESVGDSYYRLKEARVRGFGGTSLHWPIDEGWRARPLDPIDFQARPGLRWSGWPFDRGHLEPFYLRAQAICDLGPYTYDVADWREPGVAEPFPLDGSSVHSTIFQLGSTKFDGYRGELRRASNVRLLVHATAVNLAADRHPAHVEQVDVKRPDGRSLTVRARQVVLAAGGIENARLLLLSDGRHCHGLGNEHDLVGRYFMERLSARAGFVRPTNPAVIKRAGLYNVRSTEGTRVQATLSINEKVMRREQLLNCTFFIMPRTNAFLSEGTRSLTTLLKGRKRRPRPPYIQGHLVNIVTGLDDLGMVLGQRFRRGADETVALMLRVQAEQTPNPASRVTLVERRDTLGCRRVRLDWRVCEDDRRSIRRSQELVGQAFSRAGLGQAGLLLGDEKPPAIFEGNYHHMGTTRMHPDPSRGVVDADGRVHGMANVFVAGSSVFPTAGCSNPTLTVVALGLRLARHLEKVLSKDPVPFTTGARVKEDV